MAKRKAAGEDAGDTDVAVAGEPSVAVVKPFIWVETPTGGEPYPVEVSEPVEPRERAVTVNGQRFEHCGEYLGAWVYRRMEK